MGYRDPKKTAYINVLLIVVNVFYFIFLEMTGSSENSLFITQHGAMYESLVTESGECYRLLTSTFMYFGISHVVNNTLMPFILGDNMERALGHIKYLSFYLICGVGVSIAFMTVNVINKELVVFARVSGVISGVIGGLLYTVAVNHSRLEDSSTRQLVAVTLCSLYFGFISGGMDNVAHIVGLLIDIVMVMSLYKKPKPVYKDRLRE